MSPAQPDPIDQALRRSDLAAQADLSTRELDGLERRVMANITASRSEPRPMPTWLPAAVAAGVIALVTVRLVRDPAPAAPDTAPARTIASAGQGPALNFIHAERDALTLADLPLPPAARRVLLADFERFADAAVVRLTEGAQIDLDGGAASGVFSLQLPAGEGSLWLDVPAAHRNAAAGVSAWIRGANRRVSVHLTAVLEDGAEREISGLALEPDEWRLVFFPLDSAGFRAAGGVRSLRFTLTGREPARLDKIELWTTAGEVRR